MDGCQVGDGMPVGEMAEGPWIAGISGGASPLLESRAFHFLFILSALTRSHHHSLPTLSTAPSARLPFALRLRRAPSRPIFCV